MRYLVWYIVRASYTPTLSSIQRTIARVCMEDIYVYIQTDRRQAIVSQNPLSLPPLSLSSRSLSHYLAVDMTISPGVEEMGLNVRRWHSRGVMGNTWPSGLARRNSGRRAPVIIADIIQTMSE